MSNTETALVLQSEAIVKLVEILSKVLDAKANDQAALAEAKAEIEKLLAADNNNAATVGTATEALNALTEKLLAVVPAEPTV